jgi:MoxR-like ATPase
MTVKERIKTLLDQLNTGIYEKEDVMALALLSSIAGESIFLLGPPGVAKSLIARRLKYAYKDATVFEYLMSRFSTPDEIFGPVSLSKLKEDKYVRIIENYLPAAEVVFLDEIWKAGPSIQNALLTILNEKKFRNGEKEIDVPMKALISASNELPEKEQGIEALWDRFLVRIVVEGIEDREKFENMIKMPTLSSKDEDTKLKNIITEIISNDDYDKWSKEINLIVIPENVFNVIQVIRNKIELHNQNEENTEKQIYVSDRRWRKIVRLMRTSAFLNDRTEVDLMDCFLIKHCIWNEEGQIQKVSGFVNDAIRENGTPLDMDLQTERNLFTELTREIEKNTSKKTGVTPVVEQNPDGTKYYRLAENYKDNYSLIACDTIDKLAENDVNVKIFSDDFTKKIDCDIKKSNKKNSVELKENNYTYNWKTCEFKTEPVIKPYKKSPTRGDYELWNNETKKLLSALNEKRIETERYWSTFSESFYTNIFVNKEKADEHIKAKIDTVINDINKFLIDINEIRRKYQSIYNANE